MAPRYLAAGGAKILVKQRVFLWPKVRNKEVIPNKQRHGVTRMIVTTIRIQTTPENRKELMQTFRLLSNPIQSESGCKSCRIYREDDNEESVIVIQEWDSRNHLESHLHSDEFAVMIGAMSLLEQPQIVEFKVLDQLECSCSVDAIRARNFSMKR